VAKLPCFAFGGGGDFGGDGGAHKDPLGPTF
jgi:hypothetical protein